MGDGGRDESYKLEKEIRDLLLLKLWQINVSFENSFGPHSHLSLSKLLKYQ
jgi:hypothetical protein